MIAILFWVQNAIIAFAHCKTSAVDMQGNQSSERAREEFSSKLLKIAFANKLHR
jgi:hypothetical protein